MIDFLLRPFRRNFGKDKLFYAAIDDMFGFIPNNIELYKLALIHKSASVVTDDGRQINNERLEYLGDAVIETVTSDYLFIEYPDMNEGFLTQLRSKMVSRQTLNEVAKRIGLDDYVISHTSAGMSQKHIFGDAFEAMMGAIYLDQGYEFVNRLLINKIFANYIKADNLAEAETDFKSRLIEWCQKNHHTIRFSTHNDKNYSSAHPFFYCKVLIDNIEVGYGAGDSKKEAEQRAAYSVAQGVSDADYTKLMDRLDTLESKQLLRAQPQQSQQSQQTSQHAEKQKSAEKPQEVRSQESKPQREEKHQPQTVKKQEEVKPKHQESVSPEKRATEPIVEPLADATAVATPEPKAKAHRSRSRKSEESQPNVVENNVASQETPPAEEENQLVKRASTRKPKAKKAGEKSAEPNKPEQEEQSTDAVKTAKEKPAKPVAEKNEKAEITDKAVKREKRADKGEKSAKQVKENPEKSEKSDESEKSEKPEKLARAKRSRSRKKSASEAEQSLNNIAEDVNALMAEVEKLTKEGV